MIKRLYVHNFRCLENFELSISDKPSTLLVGRNGSGKSTVGFALELLQSIARGTNKVGHLLRPVDFTRGQTHVPMRFEIEAVLNGKVYGYTLALELPEGFRELRVREENLTVDGKPVYTRNTSEVELARTSKDPVAKFLVDWHLVALPVIQEQSTADPLYVFKTWLARMLILAPIPSLMTGDSSDEILEPDRQVVKFGDWWSGLLAHSPASYTPIDKYLKGIMPDFKDIKNPPVGRESRSLAVQFQQDQAILSLPFSSLSDGEKCFFVCAIVLAANDAYGPVFCFWDEPDNYLSLSEVGHFVMALRRSFQNGGQLVVTSHNPEAIRQFSDYNTLLLQRRSHLEPIVVRPIADVQYSGDLIDALIRGDV